MAYNKFLRFSSVLFLLSSCTSRQNLAPACEKSVISESIDSTYHPSTQVDQSFTHLYLVDKVEQNYLIRGAFPIGENGGFDGKHLRANLKIFLETQGESLSPSALLLDLTLMNMLSERKKLKSEKRWFQEHPDQGHLWIYPLYGTSSNPLQYPSKQRTEIASKEDIDGLKSLMVQLHKIMQSSCGRPYLIYMHCRAGKDRTGEASAAYLMQFKGVSYADAFGLNEKIADRPLHEERLNALRWYAFYLRDVLHIPTVGPIEGQ